MSRRQHRSIRNTTKRSRAAAVGLALCLLAGLAVVTATSVDPAAAQGECSPLDRTGTRCRIGGGTPPGPGETTVRPGGAPSLVFKWFSVPAATCDASTSSGWTPLSDLASAIFDLSLLPGATNPAEPGVIWVGELIHPTSGPTNTGYLACVGVTEGLPTLPPLPPTTAEIWGAVLTFEPAVNLDPYVRGLTGLETYMWYEGLVSDTLTLTLGGYGVVATISAVEFSWDMDGESREGEQIYTSSVPGSADAPAATHTYALPAEVVVIHSIGWEGSAVLTGPGLPVGGISIDLGNATISTARAYDVIEVRTPVINGNSPEGE